MRRLFGLAAAAAVLVAGCGGTNDKAQSAATPAATATAPAGSAMKLAIAADPGGAIRFTHTTLTAKAGRVEIEFSNRSQLPHAVTITGNGVDASTKVVTDADAPPVTVDLKPGTYTFFCPVDDHREEGMQGTLTVR